MGKVLMRTLSVFNGVVFVYENSTERVKDNCVCKYNLFL